jgi:photosystem II stability/assembly factor-like uncharacterized protein
MFKRFCTLLVGCIVLFNVTGFQKMDSGGVQMKWASIGPWGGNVTLISADPQNSAILYAGTYGGLYRSTDGGSKWKALNVTSTPFTAEGVAINPVHGEIVYASTGQSLVYKSIDSGDHWSPASTGLPSSGTTAIVIDPRQPDLLYAATYGQGIYKTSDAGGSWTPANKGIEEAYGGILAFAPNDPSELYFLSGMSVYKTSDAGGSWHKLPVPEDSYHDIAFDMGGIYLASANHGVLKSTNEGATWEEANTGLPRLPFNNISIASIVTDAAQPDTLYTAVYMDGVYKTTDGGQHWIRLTNELSNIEFQKLYWVSSPSLMLYALASNIGILRSTDGISWQPAMEGISSLHINRIVTDPTRPGTVYAGTGGNGLFKSTNWGTRWTHLDALPCTSVLDIAVNRSDHRVLYAGCDGGGIYASADGGETWRPVPMGHEPGFVEVIDIDLDPSNPRIIYAVEWTGDVYVSRDAGASWSDALGAEASQLVEIDPQHPNVIYGSGAQLKKSTDGGKTWTPLVNGLPEMTGVGDLVINPIHTDTIYAYVWDQGVYKSYNGGASWNQANNGLPGPSVTSLAITPRLPFILYATTWDYGVYWSYDAGASWASFGEGLETMDVMTAAVDWFIPWKIYAGTNDKGVFVTHNPRPHIIRLGSATLQHGSQMMMVTVEGEGFLPETSLNLGGQALLTTYVTDTILQAEVPIPVSGLISGALTANNPEPGGGVSDPLPVSIDPGGLKFTASVYIPLLSR